MAYSLACHKNLFCETSINRRPFQSTSLPPGALAWAMIEGKAKGPTSGATFAGWEFWRLCAKGQKANFRGTKLACEEEGGHAYWRKNPKEPGGHRHGPQMGTGGVAAQAGALGLPAAHKGGAMQRYPHGSVISSGAAIVPNFCVASSERNKDSSRHTNTHQMEVDIFGNPGLTFFGCQ